METTQQHKKYYQASSPAPFSAIRKRILRNAFRKHFCAVAGFAGCDIAAVPHPKAGVFELTSNKRAPWPIKM